jgi:Zn-finger nucleic acid-binding protein
MLSKQRADVTVAQCSSCEGIFLRRIDLGALIEQEHDWHLSSGPTTQPIPRITAGMAAPTITLEARQSRSFLDELFGS